MTTNQQKSLIDFAKRASDSISNLLYDFNELCKKEEKDFIHLVSQHVDININTYATLTEQFSMNIWKDYQLVEKLHSSLKDKNVVHVKNIVKILTEIGKESDQNINTQLKCKLQMHFAKFHEELRKSINLVVDQSLQKVNFFTDDQNIPVSKLTIVNNQVNDINTQTEPVNSNSGTSNKIFDLGEINLQSLNDSKRCDLIRMKHFSPDENYVFPVTVQKNQKKDIRKASHEHLKSFSWLVFSDYSKGYFCLPCSLVFNGSSFSYDTIQFKTHNLEYLITKPLTTFNDLVGV